MLPRCTLDTSLRLLDTGARRAIENMAIDEAIMREVSIHMSPPTLRLYSWSPAAISLGYFQSLEDEVDKDACAREGVDIVRRMTGGGAVFHETELTYSIILPEEPALVSDDIQESYSQLCTPLVDALASLGIEAEFKPVNDIITGGKKISGNAQTRRDKSILQHGTMLLGLDVPKMFSLLKVPDEKMRDKMAASAGERVTSVTDLIGAFSEDELKSALSSAFAQRLRLNLAPGALTPNEAALADTLAAKYASFDWTYKR